MTINAIITGAICAAIGVFVIAGLLASHWAWKASKHVRGHLRFSREWWSRPELLTEKGLTYLIWSRRAAAVALWAALAPIVIVAVRSCFGWISGS